MIFFGASGHAKVVIEAWIASGGKVTSIFDDDANRKTILAYPVSSNYLPADFLSKDTCISIGANAARKRVSERLPANFRSVIHPSAIISDSVVMGKGTVVMAGVVINAGSQIGRHVILNTASVVEHDCFVEDFVHISPHVTLCGGVTVGEGSHVGAGSTVIQNKKIGKWATIGAGSVIIDDVPDFAVVVGVPGKVIKSTKI